MTDLRVYRLLLLSTRPNPGTQRFYGQYRQLEGQGLVTWQLGFASITNKGYEWLGRYRHECPSV